MRFRKGDLIIVNNNPICDSLYLKQGWVPVVEVETPVVVEQSPTAETTPPLTAESLSIVDEPNTQIEIEIKEEVKTPTVKVEPIKKTSPKSTATKRTYNKAK